MQWGKDKKRTFAAVPNLGLQWVSNYLTCSTNKASVKTEAFVIFGIARVINHKILVEMRKMRLPD